MTKRSPYNRLNRQESRKVEDALLALGRERIQKEDLTQGEAAERFAQELGFPVTTANIRTAAVVLGWREWPTELATELAKRLAPCRREQALLQQIADLRRRVERLEGIKVAVCPGGEKTPDLDWMA